MKLVKPYNVKIIPEIFLDFARLETPKPLSNILPKSSPKPHLYLLSYFDFNTGVCWWFVDGFMRGIKENP